MEKKNQKNGSEFVGCVLGVIICLLAMNLAVNEANASLVINGSFELGTDEIPLNQWQNIPLGSSDITGWTVSRSNIDIGNLYWEASDGNKSLDLNGTPGVGGIAQTFATTPGLLYKVIFDQAANPDIGSRISNIGVQAAGQSEQYSFNCTGYNKSNMGWVTRTWQFTAVDISTTLEFYSLDTETNRQGPALDNVIVTAIPEPATLCLLGLGSIVGLRRKRKI